VISSCFVSFSYFPFKFLNFLITLVKTFVQVNNEAVDNLCKSNLKNGDHVLVNFSSSKAKKA